MKQASRAALRPSTAVLLLLVALLGLPAVAATVRIDTNDDPEARLEIRTVHLPSGEERELYVVTASRVTVTRDEVVITATRIEFDPGEEIVRIIGHGQVERPGEVLSGEDLVVDLGDGRLRGDDVWVVTDRVDVRGARVQRVEGRIQLFDGRFGPCGRCGQQVEDYAFVAERIEILPGDRLIAWDVVVLVRNAPFLPLPLLVLPLAETERIPRLELKRGSEASPASLSVDWPYVSGANAFGTLRARLSFELADAGGSSLENRILGGRVERSYLAGGVFHRFYDDRGAGRIELDVRPPLQAETRRRPTVFLEARYATDLPAGDHSWSVRLARDDERRPDLVEAELFVATSVAPWRAELSSRVAVPLVPDAAQRPSWADARTPRLAPLRVRLREADGFPIHLGPFTLEAASLDVGVFEDSPDPTNRSAIGTADPFAARLELRHRTTLEPVSLHGVEVSGSVDFTGRYYATEERQIDWDSRLRARLPLGRLGAFEIALRRDTAEGETPFAFDRIPLRTRSDLQASLDLRLAVGWRLAASGGWLIEDDRGPEDVGWLPTNVRLEGFTDRQDLSLTLTHRAEPQRGDAGTLELVAGASVPSSRWTARSELRARLDLDPARHAGGATSGASEASEIVVSIDVGASSLLVVSAEGGFGADVDPDEASWRPLTLAATLGTLAPDDGRPGVRASWALDPNDGTTVAAGYQATAEAGQLRAELEQRFGPAGGAPGRHRMQLAWTDRVRLSVEGVEAIPADWVGLAPDPAARRSLLVRIEDDGADAGTLFQLTYRTERSTVDGTTEFRSSRLEARARLAERRILDDRLSFELDGFADLRLADDALARNFLRRANLRFAVDAAGRVGLQGTVGYRGSYDPTSELVTSGRLALEEVAVVVRASRELYLGASMNDVWEIVADAPDPAFAFDPRPTVFATWDRCCWAAYASWDTRTGEVILTIGAPGQPEGAQLALDPDPGRAIPWGEPGDAP